MNNEKSRNGIKWMISLMVAAFVLLSCFLAYSKAAQAEEPEWSERKDYVIDLTKGYHYIDSANPAGDDLNEEYRAFCSWERLPQWLNITCSTDGDDDVNVSRKLDLDKDGTFDVLFRYIQNREYGMGDTVVVPIAGGSIKDRITLTGTADSPFLSVTFILNNSKIKEEYRIKVTGGRAGAYMEDPATGEWAWKEIKTAAPGTPLSIQADDNAVQKGRYIKEWSSADFKFPKRAPNVIIGAFVMPAHDLTVSPVIEAQKPLKITLGRGKLGEGMSEWRVLDQWDESSAFYQSAGRHDSGECIDLDGDGTEDIYLSPWKSTTAICPLPIHSINGEYTLKGKNDQPYWPITLVFPEKAYTFDLSEGLIAGYYGSGKTIQLLKANLKEFEIAERPGFYDIDRNGEPDIRISTYEPKDDTDRGINQPELVVLETYSLGESYVIPASKDGFQKPVTLVQKHKPEYYAVSIEVTGGGTVKLIEQETITGEFSVEYGNESTSEFTVYKGDGRYYLKDNTYGESYPFIESSGNRFLKGTAVYPLIIPDPGYQFKIMIAGNDYTSSLGARRAITVNGDVSILVEFEEIPQITATPTPTPTATPVPTEKAIENPSEKPTDVPEATPEVTPKGSDGGQSGSSGINPLWILIPLAVVILGAVAIIVFVRKDREEKS